MNGWRIAALEPDEKGLELAAAARFSRVTPGYVLLYCDGEIPEGSVEIPAEEFGRLSAGDVRWMTACRVARLEAELEKKKPEMLEWMSNKVREMEEMLAALEKEG